MRFLFLFILFVSLPVSAVTFTVETNTDGTVSTSTVSINNDLLYRAKNSDINTRLSELLQGVTKSLSTESANNLLLEDLQTELSRISEEVVRVAQQDTYSDVELPKLAKELGALSTKVVPLVSQSNNLEKHINNDMWIQNKIFNEYPNGHNGDNLITQHNTNYNDYGTKSNMNIEVYKKFKNKCLGGFTINYSIGSTGIGVKKIQEFLNLNSETQLGTIGAGSPGQETNYFGLATLKAVKKFQALYGANILKSIGLSAPTGYWGPSTRKTANKLAGCDE